MKIPDPKFVLRNPKGDAPTPINFVMRFNNQRVYINTGEMIHPQFWDIKRQRIKNTVKLPQNAEINRWLDKFSEVGKDVFRTMVLDGISPTPKTVKDEIDKNLNLQHTNEDKTFIGSVENLILEYIPLKRPKTIVAYRNTLKHLKAFSSYTGRPIEFSNIDLTFYNELMSYFNTQLNFAKNTTANHIKNLKFFLNEATERGINKKLDYKSKKFKKTVEDVEKIYLREAEITLLYELDLSASKKHERVRDLFIIACYTGLRVSDFIRIKKENIYQENNKSYIKINTQKTDELVVIPVHWMVRDILAKYNGNIPKPISNQKMNDYLKEIGEKAKINNSIIINKTVGGEHTTLIYKKYELITCHVARRSFATNSFLAGIPSISIMKITGHRTDKVFLKYIRITAQENAAKVADHAFFSSK